MQQIILEDVQKIVSEMKEDLFVFEGKTLLVSGGAGFICSYFLDVISYLNDNYFKTPCRLICVDNLINSATDRISHLLEKPYFTFINQDISTPLSLEGDIDFIIHGASLASPALYRKYPLETIEANILGARNLLSLAIKKNTKSFLYLSSSEVYGDPTEGNIPTPEEYLGNVSTLGPRACYDESKRMAETLCVTFFNKHNIPVKIVRPFNIYGPGMPLQDKRVIPDFASNALHNEPITILSSGKDTRTFCYVADAVKGFIKILLSDFNGQVFNIGDDSEEVSIGSLAQRINEIFDNKLEIIKKVSDDPHYLTDNPKRRCPDLTKTKKLLGYSPETNLKTGLERTIAWYKSIHKS